MVWLGEVMCMMDLDIGMITCDEDLVVSNGWVNACMSLLFQGMAEWRWGIVSSTIWPLWDHWHHWVLHSKIQGPWKHWIVSLTSYNKSASSLGKYFNLHTLQNWSIQRKASVEKFRFVTVTMLLRLWERHFVPRWLPWLCPLTRKRHLVTMLYG